MARITITPGRVIGRVHPRLYGSFVEHLGRCVYGGIWEEGSPLADERGYRCDVRDAVREFGVTQLRYPGGNFVSAYHWRDGVGPRDTRPARRELAWDGIESNRFGTDEFLAYCAELPCEPFLCVNLGTGTPEEAADWLEYCNGSRPTAIARERARNGHPDPYGVRLWGLGNEMYGPWQIGQRAARDYALVARETAKAMRLVDPTVELIAAGHEDGPSWNATLLEEAARFIDHVSLHVYVGSDDTAEALAQPLLIERLARQHAALIDLVLTDLGIERRIGIAVDEWNVWYRTVPRASLEVAALEGADTRPDAIPAAQAITLEETYNLRDALAVACCLNALLRCADVVSVANMAQLVNAIAPIRSTPSGLLLQATYYPFALYRRLMGPTAVAADVAVEGYDRRVRSLNTKAMTVHAPYLDTAATIDAASGTLTCSVVNRSPGDEVEADVRVVGAQPASEVEVWTITGPHPDARNTFEHPDVVAPRRTVIDGDALRRLCFAPMSVTVFRVRVG